MLPLRGLVPLAIPPSPRLRETVIEQSPVADDRMPGVRRPNHAEAYHPLNCVLQRTSQSWSPLTSEPANGLFGICVEVTFLIAGNWIRWSANSWKRTRARSR